ncbi:hypothetical protein WJX79_007696 [Trebouxia sp. C0005]
MMRLAFTRGALDLQAVAMLVAADLAKLDLSQSKPSFAIDSDATPWLMKGNWPMLEHLDIQTNKIKYDRWRTCYPTRETGLSNLGRSPTPYVKSRPPDRRRDSVQQEVSEVLLALCL